MQNIEWDPLEGYSRYEINRKVQIRNVKTKRILNGGIIHDGYVMVNLTYADKKTRTQTLHVLVAKQYIPNPDNKPFINHIDEDRTNCAVANLEWVTSHENANHGSRNKKISEIKSKPINEYDKDGNYIRTWVSGKSMALYYNLCSSSVPRCAQGKIPSIVSHQIRYYEGNIDNISTKIKNCRSNGYYDKYEFSREIPPEYLYKHKDKSKKELFLGTINRQVTTQPSMSTTTKNMEEIISYVENLENELEKLKTENKDLRRMLNLS